MQTRLKVVKESQAAQAAQLEEIRDAVETERAARPESVGAIAATSYIHSRTVHRTSATRPQYGACDPIRVEEKKRAVVLAKEAAVRWTGESLQLAVSSVVLDNMPNRQLRGPPDTLYKAVRRRCG